MRNSTLLWLLQIMVFTMIFFDVHHAMAQEDTEKENVKSFEGEVRELVSFLEFSMNMIGNPSYSVKDKDEIINKSYLKAFRDNKVQIEDDLVAQRDVVTNKDVQAYLKDVDFFFKQVKFKFNILDIAQNVNQEGKMFFTVKCMRNMKGVTIEDDTVDSDQERYIEVNLNDAAQDLKIASIYTTKLSRDEELTYWWNELNTAWKVQLGAGIQIKEGLLLYQIDEFSDTTYVKGGVQIQDTIKIINFVKQAANYEFINLSGSKIINDLKPLDQMKNLKRLDISSSVIVDLFPIRNLTTIEVLNCSNTKVSDLEPLKYSKSLQELYIDNTPINDLTEIESFDKLRVLHLRQTVIDSLPSSDRLMFLQELVCSNTNLLNLDSIGRMKSLEVLDFSNTAVADVGPLASLSKLRELNMSNTKVTDLKPLKSLSALETLNIENTEIADLDGLYGLTNLKVIQAEQAKLDMDDFRKLNESLPDVNLIFFTEKLQEFWDGLDTHWKDLILTSLDIEGSMPKEQLHNILKIKALKIHESAKDLLPLKFMPMLTDLDFSNTIISDISPLSNMTSLSVIKGEKSMVEDLSPIHNLSNLKKINFDHTNINDISALSGMTNLDSLSFNSTGVKDILALNDVPNFEAAYFEKSQVTDEDFALLDFDEDSAVVVYKTEKLRAWWGNMDDEWQSIFRQSHDLETRPSAEELHKLAAIKSLEVKSFSLKGLDPLPEFVRLRELKFTDSQITSLLPLTTLTMMEKLECPRNPISDIEALSSLKKLQILDLESTQIDDLDPVESLTELRVLKFSGTFVKDISPVKNLTNLEILEFSKTKVRRINSLSNLKNLKVLKCYNNRLSDKEVAEFKEINPDCDVVFY